jgi:hypothetical protein
VPFVQSRRFKHSSELLMRATAQVPVDCQGGSSARCGGADSSAVPVAGRWSGRRGRVRVRTARPNDGASGVV